MTIESENDLEKLRKIGRIVGLTIQEMGRHLQAGMTTAELDEIGARFLESHGARSAPQLCYQFPGATCISVNEQAAHGIPGARVIQEGDLVNIDVSAELDGYFADAGASFPVGKVSRLKQRLCHHTRRALDRAIDSARAGRMLNVIGRAVEHEAASCGFTIIRDLASHGVGRSLHEEPKSIYTFYNPHDRRRLHEGMVITIEPFLSDGGQHVTTHADGWTLLTEGGRASAQYEHTMVITKGRPILLTAV